MDLSSFPPEHHSLLSLANGILRVPGLVLLDWLCRVWDDPGNRNFLSALGPPALVTLVLLCAALALFLLRGKLEDLVELYCAAIAVACHVAADQLSLAVLNEARGDFQEGIDKEDGVPLHWSYSTASHLIRNRVSVSTRLSDCFPSLADVLGAALPELSSPGGPPVPPRRRTPQPVVFPLGVLPVPSAPPLRVGPTGRNIAGQAFLDPQQHALRACDLPLLLLRHKDLYSGRIPHL